ncbi:MAG: 8-oxo-dGTP diphosphatase MutT [Gammaproteobacteria bacterium]
MIRVAAGIILNDVGDVLISQRRQGTHEAGAWEFPGGKIENHEEPAVALARELQEELGINVLKAAELIAYEHSYADRIVSLKFFKIQQFKGIPSGREGQLLQWVKPENLLRAGLLPADQPVVELLV